VDDVDWIKSGNIEENPELEEISNTPCPTCNGKMTVGEENAGGVCTDCYFKYSDHDSSTGE